MPRPKRTKIAPSIPITRAMEPTLIEKSKENHATISPSSSGRVTNGSDDSDGLVKTVKGGPNRRTGMAQEVTMSGALPKEDVIVAGARVKPPTGRKRLALSRVAREADHARAIEALRARREAALAAERGETIQIPSSMPEQSDVTAAILQKPMKEFVTLAGAVSLRATEQLAPATGIKSGQPQRAEPSVLGASAFKKRPRQPSLLQVIESQNQDNPATNGGDDEDDDLDDFQPDDVSTPFLKPFSQSNFQRGSLASSSSSQQSSGSKKRKLSPPEIQVPASQPLSTRTSSPPPLPYDDLYGVSTENDEPEVNLPSSNPDRPEPTLPRPRPTHTPPPKIWDDTQAPYESSSPQHPELETRVTRSKPVSEPKITRKQPSPGPSPVSPTSSPPTPAPVSRPLKPLSTTTLQNLLPRRRVRSRPKSALGAFDIPSSDPPPSSDVDAESVARDEDEDELSYHTASKPKKKGTQRRPTLPTKPRKPQAPKPKAQSKTYARKKAGDEDAENVVQDSDSEVLIQGIEGKGRGKDNAKLGAEAKKTLQRIARHFQEVDEWELEVEEITGEGSSQVDAR